MPDPIVQVDAFTDRAFAGNPAAVCLLETSRDDRWMQNVAREMNLSETAFLRRRDDGFALRWFTPSTEVDLCGHATLASAHVLFEDGHVPTDGRAVFHTKSGVLTAKRDGACITMDFPSEPPRDVVPPPPLLAALGVDPVAVQKNRMDYLVEVDSEAWLRSYQPDFALLGQVDARGIILTALAAPPFDFVSRFFGPGCGVPEDPVTGSAHCCLGPYWAGRLGRNTLTGFQASARGGVVHVTVAGDRVLLGGQAVTVLRGELI